MKFENIVRDVKNKSGLTIGFVLDPFEPYKPAFDKGYWVGGKTKTIEIPLDLFTTPVTRQVIHSFCWTTEIEYLGFWVNPETGKVEVEGVDYVEDHREAISLGFKREQNYIYNIQTEKSHKVKYFDRDNIRDLEYRWNMDGFPILLIYTNDLIVSVVDDLERNVLEVALSDKENVFSTKTIPKRLSRNRAV